MEALKLIAFSLCFIAVFTWYANFIPQVESRPPRKISLDTPMSADEMIEAGAQVFNGKGTCNICHAIGRPGNRGPDLASVGERAAGRKPGLDAKGYLLESLIDPGAYLVEGYGRLMPPMASILSPGEVLVTVAYLESLGGTVDIAADDVRKALAAKAAAPTAAPPATPVAAVAPFGPGGPEGGSSPFGPTATVTPDPTRGAKAYNDNCLACHGPDPNVEGPVGPRIKGSPLELVEARVLRADYPPGYKPQRPTRLMPPMPHLRDEVVHIASYLAQ